MKILHCAAVPRPRAPAFIAASDICLVQLWNSEVFKTLIPTKILESMVCGRPAIVGADGEARRLVEEARGGMALEPEDPEALATAIMLLHRHPDLRCSMGERGRQYVVRNFTRSQTAASYLAVLQEALSRDVPQAVPESGALGEP